MTTTSTTTERPARPSTDRALDFGFWDYDRCRPLVDGSVSIDGVDGSFHSARIVTEIFGAMIRDRAYDVSELGITYYLRTLASGDSPFIAIPVFPNRAFRHSSIYVNTSSGIERPQDLAGKTIGELALYGHDSGLTAKGILSDEFGVTPDQSRWIVGGIDFSMDPIDFVTQPVPDGVDVTFAAPDQDLGEMLVRGEIDALMSADIPKSVLDGRPEVRQLFQDFPSVERDYHRRTGIFPIMHTVVVTRELASERPDLVRAIYQGFCDAKEQTAEQLLQMRTFNNMDRMVPWSTRLLEDDRALLGEDWWPYGIEANRKALELILRYHEEQGLTPRRYEIEELFMPGLLDT